MKGICFKEPLFHATIEGRKTQTRRTMTPQPDKVRSITQKLAGHPGYEISEKPWAPSPAYHFLMSDGEFINPRYKIDEIVYLKEPYFDCQNCEGLYYDLYKYAGHELPYTTSKWGNKLFMPESAARYFIKIIAVRAERLQDISDEDCVKEGIWMAENVGREGVSYWYGGCINSPHTTPQQAYAALIDKINGKGTWESNPWMWVYDYELIESVKPKE